MRSANWHALHNERQNLPIWCFKDRFLKLLSENNVLVLVGETGSGKTTQIPQWCAEFTKSKQRVACTQPRRLAAISVAERVACEMDTTIGDQVGYSVRFQACYSAKTTLKYLTDGMLIREAMIDEYLNQYGVIVLDEAHERTLQTEILFGILKKILQHRNGDASLKPIKVVVMSATMNVKLFKKYFDCPILAIKGRQFPVQDMFAEYKQSDYTTSTLMAVFQIHRTSNEQGDILVFCTGQEEIESLISLFRRALKQAPDSFQGLTAMPLYASMPTAQQLKVFAQHPTLNGTSSMQNGKPKSLSRRIIFATNVAETSITIPNIKYVVDTGKVKYRHYCPRTGLESLKVVNISKAQAKQRSGRAGRLFSGTCYRLFTEEEYESMEEYLPAEIKRCNLENIIFLMISIGIKNINDFQFLEIPEESRILAALKHLLSLKVIRATLPASRLHSDIMTNGNSAQSSNVQNQVICKEYELTNLGKKISMFPIEPKMGRILLAADELGCLDEAIIIVALLYIDSLFFIPSNMQEQADSILEKFKSNEGDLIMYLKVFRSFQKNLSLNKKDIKTWCKDHYINRKNLKIAIEVKKQLTKLCQSLSLKSSSCGQNTEKLRRALTSGLYNNVATMWNGKYRTQLKEDVQIHPSSCLFRARPECVLYAEIVETNKCFMRKLATIDKSWITSILRTEQSINGT